MPENLDTLTMRAAQQGQILEQYRVNIYNSELRFELLIKMFEEKGILAKEEFNKRWPLYLKNDVGVIGVNGIMEGTLLTNFYEEQ